MDLKYLKNALKRYSSDLEDMEILIQTGFDDDGKPKYEVLSFVGYLSDFSAIIIGGHEVAQKILDKQKTNGKDVLGS
jgi:hypothetical protein